MTDRYAVIGNPVSHSRSPDIHAIFARQTGEDISYDLLEAPLDGFEATVRRFFEEGGKGLNVTLPFKVEAHALAGELSRNAKLAGAANCLKIDQGEIVAENFDGTGLVRDITVNLGFPLAGRSVLLAGAGGAARGALLPLLSTLPASLAIANRTASRAIELAGEFSAYGQISGCGYDDLDGQQFDVIINATSAGLEGSASGLGAEVFHAGSLAYDMVYGKGLTPFLALAKQAGAARVADGAGMLAEQAADSFHWWRGVRPDTAEAIAAISVPLDL